MDKKQIDRRSVGGPRVSAKCEVLLPKLDPFDHTNRSLKDGTIEFNVRGGCLSFNERIYEQNIERIFPDGSTTVFKRLSVFCADESEFSIHDIKVKYMRHNEENSANGIVFRFLDFSEEQLDSLEMLQKLLPESTTANGAGAS